MITAEEYWLKHDPNLEMLDPDTIFINMIEFAKEAIKADRINLLEHVKTLFQSTWNQQLRGVQPEIDKDSIINAPNIQLK